MCDVANSTILIFQGDSGLGELKEENERKEECLFLCVLYTKAQGLGRINDGFMVIQGLERVHVTIYIQGR